MKYQTIIGLEIHVQLKTKSKMFCRCDNSGEEQEANTTVCPVCMGHPGVLPVINGQAVEWAIMAALALECKIPEYSKFDRKQYFYPDLPKGYQISQYDMPIGIKGKVVVETNGKRDRVGITRLHLEEDAAKLLHSSDGNSSYVDYNRSSTPLIEIVTDPDIESPREAKQFLQDLRLTLRYLKISEADMEKGHLRCDANISLRPVGERLDVFYPKTEIKNLNSFRAVERALEFEISRQKKLWEQGIPPDKQTTRGWNEDKGATEEQRIKEEAHDYRYFPEPDLPPMHFSFNSLEDKPQEDKENRLNIEYIKRKLPELPLKKIERFREQYGLRIEDARAVVEDAGVADFFEHVISELKAWLVSLEQVEGSEEEIWAKNKKKLTKTVSNWITTELFKLMREAKASMRDVRITAENFAEFIAMVFQNKINSSAAQTIMRVMFVTGGDPSNIMEEKNLSQMDDSEELEEAVAKVIAGNESQVREYRGGKGNVIQFFVGQVMKETGGKANPKLVKELLKKKLVDCR